jgi:hypothetical protein
MNGRGRTAGLLFAPRRFLKSFSKEVYDEQVEILRTGE